MTPELQAALSDATRKVSLLEFSLQTRKMTEVMGWPPEAVAVMEEQYRRFLALSAALQAAGSEVMLVPNRPIDEFWHAHIMDTEKYQADCQTVFGQYFHHFPYFGFRDDADIQAWNGESAAGAAIWQDAYGESLHGDDTEGDAYALDRKWIAELSAAIVAGKVNGAMKCVRKNCKPQKCK